MVQDSSTVFEELKKLFDLPENCRHVTIKIGVNIVPSVRCEYYPDEGTGELITRTFNLIENEGDQDEPVD